MPCKERIADIMNTDKRDRNFIPIAEEYIRTGRLDEAIDLLKEGITTYPDYLSARVSLGKAYIAKGMIEEAIQEFEHVVRVSPDNLLANRKLAFLYKDAGMVDSAIKSCEAVLIFSPRDIEISGLLNNLKQTSSSDDPAAPVIDFTSGWAVASEETPSDGISDEFLTESMGDICIAQGEKSKGIEIFRKILQKDPANESVRGKLMTHLGGIEGVGMGQSSGNNTASNSKVDSDTETTEQKTARLNDLLNKVRKNRG